MEIFKMVKAFNPNLIKKVVRLNGRNWRNETVLVSDVTNDQITFIRYSGAKYTYHIVDVLNKTIEIKIDHIGPEVLAQILYDIFSPYIGTELEELFEDGGWVIDYLNNTGNYEHIDFTDIPADVWEKAWDTFDDIVGRGNS